MKLVGAGRFERPPPCAQGSRPASKGSIRYNPLLMFTTAWGICFSLKSKPKAVKEMGFGTVLAQLRAAPWGAWGARKPAVSECFRVECGAF